MNPQPPTLRGTAEDVGRDDVAAGQGRGLGLGVADRGQDVLGAGDHRDVAGDRDLYVGQEELDVGGVRHDRGPRSQHLIAALDRWPAGMYADRIVLMRMVQPDPAHPVEIAGFDRGVQLAVELLERYRFGWLGRLRWPGRFAWSSWLGWPGRPGRTGWLRRFARPGGPGRRGRFGRLGRFRRLRRLGRVRRFGWAAHPPVAPGARPAWAARTAAATLTASRLPTTSCTRTPQAPASAAIADTATVAYSRCVSGSGPPGPAGAMSSPRNRLRDAPTRIRRPMLAIRSRLASSAQLWRGSFAKPRPGSRMIDSGATPPSAAAW